MIFRYLVVKGTQDIFHSKHGIMHNMICTNHASSKKFFVYNVIFFANIISQFMIFKVSMPTGCSLIVKRNMNNIEFICNEKTEKISTMLG